MKTKEFEQNFSGFAKISTREIQFFWKKNLPRKLVPAKISTIKVLKREEQQLKMQLMKALLIARQRRKDLLRGRETEMVGLTYDFNILC